MSEMELQVRAGFRPAVPAAAAMGALAAAAWVALATRAAGEMSHDELLDSGHAPGPGAILAFLGFWQLMVLATMLPPAIPAMVAGAGPARVAVREAVGLIGATCVVWSGFAVAVLAADAVLHRGVEVWPWLADRERLVASMVLVVAGVAQLSRIQRRALERGRAEPGAAWSAARSCLASCWVLMLVMFAVALESLLWMAVLAIVMAVQRLVPWGIRLARAVGVALIVAGLLSALRG